MNLETTYLGLRLKNPVIIASSPFTASLDKIVEMEGAGAGAVVLKSIFEEQILNESEFLSRFNDYPEAADYLHGYVGNDYIQGHLKLISDAKRSVGIPIIASINCMSEGKWMDYAKKIEGAGADALELNIYILPTHYEQESYEVEKLYLDIIRDVVKSVSIPVSVKLSSNFTNVLHMAGEIYNRGARGVVMFNRFADTDIDIDKIELIRADMLSSRSELRTSLRSIAMCSPLVKGLDIAVSTGVHTGEDLIKTLLSGAKAAEICTALYKSGTGVIEEMKSTLAKWMDAHGFDSVEKFRGLLSNRKSEDYNETYQRVQYMKNFPK